MKLHSLILCAVALPGIYAQDAPPAAQAPKPAPAPAVVKAKPVIRRFSAGGILSFSTFQLMKKESLTTTFSTTKNNTYTTDPKGFRLGGGAVFQGMISDKFAGVTGLTLRRVKFETNNVFTDGTKITKQNDFSGADFWEIPILLRRYSVSRMDTGARWYAEGGLALRRVRNVRSSLQTTTPDNKTVCCDESPAPVANRLGTGFSVGGGYHLIDQFGIRFIPGVRYTRWTKQTFDNQSVKSNPNQLEVSIAITF